eukprot:scaffold65442_cov61-Phaeocystis_antarctica.AAC.2
MSSRTLRTMCRQRPPTRRSETECSRRRARSAAVPHGALRRHRTAPRTGPGPRSGSARSWRAPPSRRASEDSHEESRRTGAGAAQPSRQCRRRERGTEPSTSGTA